MAKALMVQGTASNSGKSLLTAALCRIFRQAGYSTAPFKAQNMALNSYITREGLEIGRAQAVQAQAAGIEPDARMNPVLLKPSSDTGSQVIVNGEVYGNYSAKEFYAMKQSLRPKIKAAYDSLAAQYDIIVLEGAGSPAEINLKQDDLVNMGMAAMAKAPVLLCGDIDRGGVFASLAGTMLLLEPEERNLVKGMVINKFRGDIEILRPGLSQLEKLTGVPVLGVVPWLTVDIEEEDSLCEKLSHSQAGTIDIAVIRLPRISNFTDFGALELAQGIRVRYVNTPDQFGHPAMAILPGTKNTMADLLWMRQNGLESVIKKYAASGGIVFGICGGYQMLGEELRDPSQIEHGGILTGMGLLPGNTLFLPQKTRTRKQGCFSQVQGALSDLSGIPFEGYEIHMGITNSHTPLTLAGQEKGGSQQGNIYGTYYHGIFDRIEVIQALAKALYRSQGLEEAGYTVNDPEAYREKQFDLLAEGVQKSLAMEQIYQILQKGV